MAHAVVSAAPVHGRVDCTDEAVVASAKPVARSFRQPSIEVKRLDEVEEEATKRSIDAIVLNSHVHSMLLIENVDVSESLCR